METQNFTNIAHTLQTVGIATLIFAVCLFIPKINYRAKLARLPAFGGASSGEKQRKAYLESAKQMYNEGFQKVRCWIPLYPDSC